MSHLLSDFARGVLVGAGVFVLFDFFLHHVSRGFAIGKMEWQAKQKIRPPK